MRSLQRLALALGLATVLAAAASGCGPRDKIGDRLLGQDSLTNGRSNFTNQQPKPAP